MIFFKLLLKRILDKKTPFLSSRVIGTFMLSDSDDPAPLPDNAKHVIITEDYENAICTASICNDALKYIFKYNNDLGCLEIHKTINNETTVTYHYDSEYEILDEICTFVTSFIEQIHGPSRYINNSTEEEKQQAIDDYNRAFNRE